VHEDQLSADQKKTSAARAEEEPDLSVPAQPRFLTAAEIGSIDEKHVLAKIFFDPDANMAPLPYPHAYVPIRQIQSEQFIELWTSPEPVERVQYADNLQLAFNDSVLFGSLRFDFPLSGEALEAVVYKSYELLLKAAEELDYPNVVKVWNYIPSILDNVDGLECYRRFCRARHEAFTHIDNKLLQSPPAASAVGVTGTELVILFLAAKQRVEQRENPRQVNAYHYPRLYGPRSPSFARATLAPWWGKGGLFISGMASILGHESRHLGDPAKQMHEAIDNVRTMVDRAIENDHLAFDGFGSLTSLRVYLKKKEYFTIARDTLTPLLPQDTRVLFLQVDICRAELLVELDASLLPSTD